MRNSYFILLLLCLSLIGLLVLNLRTFYVVEVNKATIKKNRDDLLTIFADEQVQQLLDRMEKLENTIKQESEQESQRRAHTELQP